MKKLVEFWKKDIINKLIVFVVVLLSAAVGAFIFMIVNIPGGKSLSGIVSQFITTATPTTDVNAVFTGMAQTAEIELTPAYLRGPATITPIGGGSTATSAFTSTPFPTATSMVLYTSTSSPTLKATLTPTSRGLTIAGVNCIPAGTPKTGQVLDILDGVSARIMIDGLVYTIHYVGVDLPAVAGYAAAASMVNGNLVFQHTVQIYEDPAGNNALGSQYQYLVVDGKLVNLELIKLGLVSVVDLPSGFACHQVFLDAENAAKSAKVGQWK